MSDWDDTVQVESAGKLVDVDRCIAPLVRALNNEGFPTVASQRTQGS